MNKLKLIVAIGSIVGTGVAMVLILLDTIEREGEWYEPNVSRPRHD